MNHFITLKTGATTHQNIELSTIAAMRGLRRRLGPVGPRWFDHPHIKDCGYTAYQLETLDALARWNRFGTSDVETALATHVDLTIDLDGAIHTAFCDWPLYRHPTLGWADHGKKNFAPTLLGLLAPYGLTNWTRSAITVEGLSTGDRPVVLSVAMADIALIRADADEELSARESWGNFPVWGEGGISFRQFETVRELVIYHDGATHHESLLRRSLRATVTPGGEALVLYPGCALRFSERTWTSAELPGEAFDNLIKLVHALRLGAFYAQPEVAGNSLPTESTPLPVDEVMVDGTCRRAFATEFRLIPAPTYWLGIEYVHDGALFEAWIETSVEELAGQVPAYLMETEQGTARLNAFLQSKLGHA